jgi:hypothetical protein
MGQYHIGPSALSVDTITTQDAVVVTPTALGSINIIGTGAVTTTGNIGTHTVTIAVSGGGLKWQTVAGTSQAMLANNGYITTNVAATNFTLPGLPTVGDVVRIVGYGAVPWTITLSGGEAISFETLTSITFLNATALTDAVELIYTGIAKVWVVGSSVGTLVIP